MALQADVFLLPGATAIRGVPNGSNIRGRDAVFSRASLLIGRCLGSNRIQHEKARLAIGTIVRCDIRPCAAAVCRVDDMVARIDSPAILFIAHMDGGKPDRLPCAQGRNRRGRWCRRKGRENFFRERGQGRCC